jgi:hypothetical protein
MVKGINSVALRTHPTFHLFSCKMDNLNVLGQKKFFSFLDLGQAFGSNGL